MNNDKSQLSEKPCLAALLGSAHSGQTGLNLLEWPDSTIHHALERGLGPMLFDLTRDNPASEKSPFWDVLMGAAVTARVLTAEKQAVVCEILDNLGEDTPSVTLLKGMSTAYRFFPQPHWRAMGDIDLLVERQRIGQLEQLLKRLGFEPKSSESPDYYRHHHHTMPLYHPDRKVWIEIHHQLFHPTSAFSSIPIFSPGQAGHHTVRSEIAGRAVLVFAPEFEIAYLCSHWAATFPYPRGLMPMLDLIYLMKRCGNDIDWDRLIADVRLTKSASAIFLMFDLLRECAINLVEPPLQKRIRAAQVIVGTVSRPLLGHLVKRHLFEPLPFGRVLTANRAEILWESLLRPNRQWINLLAFPGHLLAEVWKHH